MSKKRKVISLTVTLAALLMVFSFCSPGFAETVQATLKAQYKAIKIVLNGSPATLATQPVIINGSTYLPLRALATLFNKNIDWNATTQQVTITDKPDNQIASLQAQITEKDNQITVLQAQLKAAQDESDDEDIDDTINDLEGDLFDEYEDYFDDISLDDLSLSGDEDDVEVEVDIDLDDYQDEWDDLDNDDIQDFLQDICDDIWDENDLEDADITGTIVDSSEDDELVSFTTDDGDVELDNSFSSFEDDLLDSYDTLEDVDVDDISLDGEEDDDITFTVSIDYDSNEDEWDDLIRADIRGYLQDIQDEIVDEYDDADDIIGYIVDNSDDDAYMAKINASGGVSYYLSYDPGE